MSNTSGNQFEDQLAKCPIIPVLTIDHKAQAVPLAKALVAAGVSMIEVTLRTNVALEAIREIKKNVPGLIAGAGTITSQQTLERALTAGSDFIVTPAMTRSLVKPLQDCPVPVFPGIATPGEAFEMYEAGFTHLKFFPAESYGGVKALKSIEPPLPQISFLPSGGINQSLASGYLSLSNVFAVSGSWMVDQEAVNAGNWQKVESSCRNALIF